MNALIVGTSDGIGLALTQRLLASGWTVAGISRRRAPVDSPRYRHLTFDVSAPGYSERLRDFLAGDEATPVPDLCVYCAGIGERLALGDGTALAADAQVMRVNLLAAVETISVAVPAMLAAGRGHVIGLSSIGDEVISADAPSYAASKAGLSSYLVGLGLALRPRGLFVTNLRLGFVDTKMAKAPVRPMMITAERAVDVILECVRRRPLQLTFPKRMGVLVRVLRWLTSLRVWLS